MKRYSREKIVAAYQAGMRVDELARRAGCHRTTIYNHLKAAGVTIRDDRLNPPPRPVRTVCGNGLHEWTEDNTRVDGNGERHCRACEKVRNDRLVASRIIRRFVAAQNDSATFTRG